MYDFSHSSQSKVDERTVAVEESHLELAEKTNKESGSTGERPEDEDEHEIKKGHEVGHAELGIDEPWRIHKLQDSCPCCCYLVMCSAFFWLLFVMFAASAAGMTVLIRTTEFPFYDYRHRSRERQDGVFEVHQRATYVVSSSMTPRGSIDDDTRVLLLYVGDGVDDVLTTSRLTKIQEFERQVMEKPDWERKMCRLIDGECQRPTSPIYFFADDARNPYQYFPTNYDPYPSYNNTLQFSNSYYVKPTDMNFSIDLSQSNIDKVADFWAQYGGEQQPTFQYFNVEKCQRQQAECMAIMNYSRIIPILDPTIETVLQNDSCRDRNDLLQEMYDRGNQAPGSPMFSNCFDLSAFMTSIGLGCDDALAAFGLPDITYRRICCQTCFERWFPDTYELNGVAMTIDYSDCAANTPPNQLLEVCVNHNKGTYTTTTYMALNGSFTLPQLESAVGVVLTEHGVFFSSVTCTGAPAVTPGAPTACTVAYPWANQQALGYDLFESMGFPSKLRAQMPGLQVAYERTERNVEKGLITDDAMQISVNPFWMVVDGNFGVSASLETASKASAARTTLYNGLPLEGYDSVVNDKDEQVLDLGEYCFHSWQDQFDAWGKDYGDNIKFLWDCNDMDVLFRASVLDGDFRLIMFTVLFILCYMAYVTNSWFLALNGMYMIFLNFIPTIFLYRFICQQKFFGVLQVMSMFLILSIGADDVFVTIDTWGQNNCLFGDKPTSLRISATCKAAGKVMLTTSASTIFSFIPNVFSVIPLIQTFGTFCALLVFVNYMAVCLFYPTVLYIHELYFDGAGWQELLNEGNPFPYLGYFNCGFRCTAETLPERNKRYMEQGLEHRIPDPDKKRPIDLWFSEKYYPFLHRARICVVLAGLAWFAFLLSMCGSLTPDPEPPNIFPNGYNYGVFWDVFTENFGRDVSQQNVEAWVAFGLSDPGIDRSKEWEATDPSQLGVPKYDENFNPFSAEAMEFFVALCDDLNSGERYGVENLKIDAAAAGGVGAILCPFTAFREWIWTDNEASYHLDSGINPRTKDFVSANLIRCMNETGDGVHPPKTWPIQGFWNNFYRWEDWLEDEMPTDNARYVADTSNFQSYGSQLWYNNDTWSNAPTCEGYPQISYTPKLFQINARLSVKRDYDHTDGMQLYENWEDYLGLWRSGKVGNAAVYTPISTHCDNLELDECEITDGCMYVAQISGFCKPAPVDYPGPIPEQIDCVFVTDMALFAYYFLQAQLIQECFQGIAIALTLAFVILNLATMNYIIATLSTIIIAMIVLMIIGFTVLVGWKLGLMESLIYVMVVGMSVDYVVHLGESYIESREVHEHRHGRVAEMLEVRGMSVLSGAISTMGGIAFLFGAFIIFFFKFAVVIFFLIFTSCFYSLVFFAALMDTIGPNGEFGEWKLVIQDLKLVYNGKLGLYECFMNCCVPHDSQLQPRVEADEAEKQPLNLSK